MPRNDGTRFTKAAVPTAGKALNVSDRVIGSNLRKQKLTEASGTNPSKYGSTKIKPPPSSTSSYAQDSAPYKSETKFDFSVGGPGFPPDWKKR